MNVKDIWKKKLVRLDDQKRNFGLLVIKSTGAPASRIWEVRRSSWFNFEGSDKLNFRCGDFKVLVTPLDGAAQRSVVVHMR